MNRKLYYSLDISAYSQINKIFLVTFLELALIIWLFAKEEPLAEPSARKYVKNRNNETYHISDIVFGTILKKGSNDVCKPFFASCNESSPAILVDKEKRREIFFEGHAFPDENRKISIRSPLSNKSLPCFRSHPEVLQDK